MEPTNSAPAVDQTQEINENNQSLNTQQQEKRRKVNKKTLILILIGLIVSILLFFIGYSTAPTIKSAQESPEVIYSREVAPEDKQELPKEFRYLTDPAFSKWSGSVGGILIAKDEQSFKLEPITEKRLDGGVLKIEKVPNAKTIEVVIKGELPFYFMAKNQNPEEELQKISYSNIPMNSLIRGGVDISYINNEIILEGASFSVTEQ